MCLDSGPLALSVCDLDSDSVLADCLTGVPWPAPSPSRHRSNDWRDAWLFEIELAISNFLCL